MSILAAECRLELCPRTMIAVVRLASGFGPPSVGDIDYGGVGVGDVVDREGCSGDLEVLVGK